MPYEFVQHRGTWTLETIVKNPNLTPATITRQTCKVPYHDLLVVKPANPHIWSELGSFNKDPQKISILVVCRSVMLRVWLSGGFICAVVTHLPQKLPKDCDLCGYHHLPPIHAAGFLAWLSPAPRASFIDNDMTLEGSQDAQKEPWQRHKIGKQLDPEFRNTMPDLDLCFGLFFHTLTDHDACFCLFFLCCFPHFFLGQSLQ